MCSRDTRSLLQLAIRRRTLLRKSLSLHRYGVPCVSTVIWVETLNPQLSSHCDDFTESRNQPQRRIIQPETGLWRGSIAASTVYCERYLLRRSDDGPSTWERSCKRITSLRTLARDIRHILCCSAGESNASRLTVEL